MSKICFNIVVALIFVSLVSAKLPRTHVTVSGVSSGGAMATQLHLGFSKNISGAGILAGPPYYCAGSGLTTFVCMTGPAILIPVSALEAKLRSYASAGSVDDPSNVAKDPVYVFTGKYDTIVNPGIVKINQELYAQLNANVTTNYDMPAEHCYPTDNFGEPCAILNIQNYINNCDFKMAYDMLNHLYGGHLVRPTSTTQVTGQLVLFDQTPFSNPSSSLGTGKNTRSDLSQWIQKNMVLYNPTNWNSPNLGLYNLAMPSVTVLAESKTKNKSNSMSGFDTQGFIYYPSKCTKGAKCSLHVALHGCEQGKSFIGDTFVRKTGYLEVAELNNIIVIFPQILASMTSPINPLGCWDWWGYSSSDYATKSAPQMAGIKKMTETFHLINTVFAATN